MQSVEEDEVVSQLLAFTGLEVRPEFKNETWALDFGLDSLSLFHFLLHLEKIFQFRFADEDFALAAVERFDGLLELINQRRVPA